ncbi:peptidoglycan-binding domain-containing protein [Nocardiopsis nanhaiensis]
MSKVRGIAVLIASGAAVAGIGASGTPALAQNGAPSSPPEVTASVEASEWPELEEGYVTWEVTVVKYILHDLDYYDASNADKHFDERLSEAVEEYQRDRNIPESGVVDGETWAALTADLVPMGQGDSGYGVLAVQYALAAGHGFDVPQDGLFGPATLDAVVGFQDSADLPNDGIVGYTTFQAIVSTGW